MTITIPDHFPDQDVSKHYALFYPLTQHKTDSLTSPFGVLKWLPCSADKFSTVACEHI